MLCKDFFTDADLLAARRSRCISGALQKLSFTDAGLLSAAVLTAVCVEQAANRERRLAAGAK